MAQSNSTRRRRRVIAIDGPAGAGKSTVAKLLADRLKFRYLDTGAMYRAVTLLALRAGIDSTDTARLSELAGNLDFEMSEDGRVFVCGEDVTEELRSKDVDRAVSEYSAIPEVRQALVAKQRRYVGDGAVVEGRDIGTIVFPDAAVRVFLTASPEVRAMRRLETDKGRTLEELLEDIQRRDRLDSTREASPLKAAKGVEVIDTTHLEPTAVADRIEALWREAQKGSRCS
ncbi:MAG: (d)CMP kinase [Acidimicrobiia bacterium]